MRKKDSDNDGTFKLERNKFSFKHVMEHIIRIPHECHNFIHKTCYACKIKSLVGNRKEGKKGTVEEEGDACEECILTAASKVKLLRDVLLQSMMFGVGSSSVPLQAVQKKAKQPYISHSKKSSSSFPYPASGKDNSSLTTHPKGNLWKALSLPLLP